MALRGDGLKSGGGILLTWRRALAMAATATVVGLLPGCISLPHLASVNEEAQERYEQATGFNPENAHAWFSLGRTQLEGQQFGPARKSFSRAVALKPDLLEAWIGKGQAEEMGGNPKAARESYGRALLARPGSTEARQYLARLDMKEGRIDEAEALWREAIALRPDSGAPHCGLGDTLYIQDDLSGALEEWERAFELDPSLSDLEPLIEDLRSYLAVYGRRSVQ